MVSTRWWEPTMFLLKHFSAGLDWRRPFLVLFSEESQALSLSVRLTGCVAHWNFFWKTKLAHSREKIERMSYARTLFMKPWCLLSRLNSHCVPSLSPPPTHPRSASPTNIQMYPVACKVYKCGDLTGKKIKYILAAKALKLNLDYP